MAKFAECSNDFFELVVRIMSDDEPETMPDLAYIFGQTEENASSVLDVATMLYNDGLMTKVGICNAETSHGYPGFKRWEIILTKYRHILSRDIMPVVTPYEIGINIFTEAQSLIRDSINYGWNSIYIIASLFHQVRAFVTTASVILKQSLNIKIYNKVGLNLGWNKMTRHSQGIVAGMRYEFLNTELERLNLYFQKRDLMSLTAILDYMRKRDEWNKAGLRPCFYYVNPQNGILL